MLRRAAVPLILVAALAWTGWAFGTELVKAWAPIPDKPAPLPQRWEPRTPAARELLSWLDEVDRTLPKGSPVAVAPRPLPGSEEFFLYLWVAYGLPRHDVVRASQAWTWKRADFVVTYRMRHGDPGWVKLLGRPPEDVLPLAPQPVLDGPVGAVYRVDPSGRSSP